MIKSILFASALLLTGCTIPSFQDDNESWAANNVQFAVNKINCYASDKTNDVWEVKDSLAWLHLYSQAKNSKDIQPMIELMQGSANTFNGDISTTACLIKKKIMVEQAADLTKTIVRRY